MTDVELTQEEIELRKINEEIAAIQAKRELLQAETEKNSEIQRKRLELQREKVRLDNADVIARYTAEKGPRGVAWDALEFDAGVAIFRKPNRAKWNEWAATNMSLDPKDFMPLVSSCVDHPTMVEFDQFITNQPGKQIAAASIVQRLGGSNQKEVEGK